MLHVLTVCPNIVTWHKKHKTFVWNVCVQKMILCVWCGEWYQCGSSWSVCTECLNRGGWQNFHVSPHADVSGYCVIHKEKGDTVASSWIHPSVCVCAVRVICNFNLKLVHLLMSALWICHHIWHHMIRTLSFILILSFLFACVFAICPGAVL